MSLFVTMVSVVLLQWKKAYSKFYCFLLCPLCYDILAEIE